METYDKIIIELNNFRFKRNSISYQYLIDVIYIVVDNNLIVRDFKHNVYPLVARKYQTKSENVLWCISKLIRLMYLNTEEEIIRKYFRTEYDETPSTKAFVLYISYRILRKF